MPVPVIALPTRLEELADSIQLTNPVTGDLLTFDGAFWVNLPAPGGGTGDVSQAYVDSRDALRVLKAGDTMTGRLTLPNLTLGSLNGLLKATAGDVGTGATTSDLAEGSNLYFTNTRVDDRITLQKAAANGLATLGADSKIPTSQLPALAISETFVVASQAAMLALVAQQGDVAVRTDVSKTFILAGTDPTVLANWQEVLVPTGGGGSPVLSVNGQTGAVTLITTDINEGTNLYYTDARARAAFGFTPANVAGDTFTGKVIFDDGLDVMTAVKILNAAGDFGISLKSPSALAVNRNYVLPTADPLNGQFLSALAPDGSGNVVLSWASLSGNRIVTVDQGGKGDYTTITDAVAFVAGQTRDANNLWLIRVNPGVYTEAPFTVPTFTALIGLTLQAQIGTGAETKILASASLTSGTFISVDSGGLIAGFIVSASAASGATADTYVVSTPGAGTGTSFRAANLIVQGSNAGTTFLHSGFGGLFSANNIIFNLSGSNETCCVRYSGGFPSLANSILSAVVKYGIYVSASSGTMRLANCSFDGDTPVNSGGEVYAPGAGKVRAINTNVRTLAGTNAATVLSYTDRVPTIRGKRKPSAVDQTPWSLDGLSGQTAPIGLISLNGTETIRIDEQGRIQHSVSELFRNSGFTVGLKAPTLAANGPVWALPAVDGVAKSCVVTDGAGNLSIGRKTRRAVIGLTDGATINTDASAADMFTVTLGGNRTLAAPTNAVDGDEREWWIKQDATGGRTLTFDTGVGGFAFSTDLPSSAVVPSTTANSISGFKAKYLTLAGKWLVTGKLAGF